MKTNSHPGDVQQVTIWGNHSATQFPDIHHTKIKGRNALELVDEGWYKDEMIPVVQQRGTAVIKARGASSAASAANAALETMRDWITETPADDWVSMAVCSGGEYDISTGLFYSFPLRTRQGKVTIEEDLPVNEFSRAMMKKTEQELLEEREAIKDLLP